MKIKLKKDWDFFPQIDKPLGHFTGRKLIRDRLMNEVARRGSGAILVSGSRGVGKTSLVSESIRLVGVALTESNKESASTSFQGFKILKKKWTSIY